MLIMKSPSVRLLIVIALAVVLIPIVACAGATNADCQEKYKLLTEGVWYDEDVEWFEANCTVRNGNIEAR